MLNIEFVNLSNIDLPIFDIFFHTHHIDNNYITKFENLQFRYYIRETAQWDIKYFLVSIVSDKLCKIGIFYDRNDNSAIEFQFKIGEKYWESKLFALCSFSETADCCSIFSHLN